MHAKKLDSNQTATVYVLNAERNKSSIGANNKVRKERIHRYKLNQSLEEEVAYLRNEQKALHEMLVSREEIASSYEGDSKDMEDLKNKVHDMDKRLAIIEERTKKLDDLPTAIEIKQIISEVIDNKNLATVDKVELEINKSRNIQLTWTITTIIAVVSLAVAALKLLP
ncbi:hypothetical protein [Bacillus thuringiensis]|uniref:hypothetical protein n=1 Tax=Bacillus thuringiensis TaxID=1428 RepID=UPI0020D25781|nr:hypothetical protein [Bacillus thuringiensis]